MMPILLISCTEIKRFHFHPHQREHRRRNTKMNVTVHEYRFAWCMKMCVSGAISTSTRLSLFSGNLFSPTVSHSPTISSHRPLYLTNSFVSRLCKHTMFRHKTASTLLMALNTHMVLDIGYEVCLIRLSKFHHVIHYDICIHI